MGSFCANLADLQIKKDLELKRFASANYDCNMDTATPYVINRIEKILQTPMQDHRMFIVWMILPQYLINIRKLSATESYTVIQKWLDRCNELSKLDRAHTKQKLKAGFKAAEKGFRPISAEKLKNWKPKLYEIVKYVNRN